LLMKTGGIYVQHARMVSIGFLAQKMSLAIVRIVMKKCLDV